jgi:uncharacterized membrane protein YebE (DUF533 family)
MKRLTIGTRACTEILALLVHVAWADGQLADDEKSGVRAAATVLNLTKEQRARLEDLLAAPVGLDDIIVESLSAHERAYAFVAATWMTGVDAEVHDKEKGALDHIADRFNLDAARRGELSAIARDLLHLHKGKKEWAHDLVTLFKSIPKRLDASDHEELEVAFEDE